MQQSMKPRSRPSPLSRAKTKTKKPAARQKAASSAPRSNFPPGRERSARQRSKPRPSAAPARREKAACAA